jgi:hypothetical protein
MKKPSKIRSEGFFFPVSTDKKDWEVLVDIP